ncbi:hypothetical protein [Alkalinema sp. FACHB-956]|uniref:hypothetical protein n=1 Tax=Alkalinema sp. FACHB-956 TaxID=2692768 RepID=UPI001683AAC4|nr:hypothetical protein [Alkalinema sp. FACHB-956]MBD2328090.1 hypothetical protein [Alkalinema sp. FACHB-956]
MSTNLILYYNSDTGAGAVGLLDSQGNHATLKDYGDFTTGWSHVVQASNGILFYNTNTGAGVIGKVDAAGNFSTVKAYSDFAKNWSHIVNLPHDYILFYNTNTGAANAVKVDAAGKLSAGKVYNNFSTGWSHIVNTSNGIFFYNTNTGAGATGRLDATGNFSTVKVYNNFSTGWSHIVNTSNGIFFYNIDTGAGAVGAIDTSGGLSTSKVYNNFSTGWSHIVNTSNGILFYNSTTGAGAVGTMDAAHNFFTLKGYGVGSFSTWTNIASESAGQQYSRPRVLPGTVQWSLTRLSAGKVDFNGGGILAKSDGTWQFWGSLYDNSTLYGDKWALGFVFDSTGHGAIARGELGAQLTGGARNGTFDISGQDPWISANWESVALSTVYTTLHVQDDWGGLIETVAGFLSKYGPQFVALVGSIL